MSRVKIEARTQNTGGQKAILSQKFKMWEGKYIVRKTDGYLFHNTPWSLKYLFKMNAGWRDFVERSRGILACCCHSSPLGGNRVQIQDRSLLKICVLGVLTAEWGEGKR